MERSSKASQVTSQVLAVLAAQRRQMDELQAQCSQLEAVALGERQRAAALQEQVMKDESLMAASTQRIQQLADQLEVVQARAAALRAENDALREDSEKEKAQADAEVARLSECIIGLRQDLDAAQSTGPESLRRSRIAGEREAITRRGLEALRAENETLRQSLEELDATVSRQSKQIAEQKVSLFESENTIQLMRKVNDTLSASKKRSDARAAELERRVAELERRAIDSAIASRSQAMRVLSGPGIAVRARNPPRQGSEAPDTGEPLIGIDDLTPIGDEVISLLCSSTSLSNSDASLLRQELERQQAHQREAYSLINEEDGSAGTAAEPGPARRSAFPLASPWPPYGRQAAMVSTEVQTTELCNPASVPSRPPTDVVDVSVGPDTPAEFCDMEVQTRIDVVVRPICLTLVQETQTDELDTSLLPGASAPGPTGVSPGSVQRLVSTRDTQGLAVVDAPLTPECQDEGIQCALDQFSGGPDDYLSRSVQVSDSYSDMITEIGAAPMLATREPESLPAVPDCSALREENEALRAEKEALLRDKAALKDSYDKMLANIRYKDAKVDELTEEISELTERLEQSSSRAVGSSRAVSTDPPDSLGPELDAHCQEQLGECEDQLELAQRELQRVTQEMGAQIAELTARVGELKAKLAEAVFDRDATKSLVERAKAEANQLQAELERVRGEFIEKDSELRRATSTNTGLEAEVSDLRDRLSYANSERHRLKGRTNDLVIYSTRLRKAVYTLNEFVHSNHEPPQALLFRMAEVLEGVLSVRQAGVTVPSEPEPPAVKPASRGKPPKATKPASRHHSPRRRSPSRGRSHSRPARASDSSELHDLSSDSEHAHRSPRHHLHRERQTADAQIGPSRPPSAMPDKAEAKVQASFADAVTADRSQPDFRGESREEVPDFPEGRQQVDSSAPRMRVVQANTGVEAHIPPVPVQSSPPPLLEGAAFGEDIAAGLDLGGDAGPSPALGLESPSTQSGTFHSQTERDGVLRERPDRQEAELADPLNGMTNGEPKGLPGSRSISGGSQNSPGPASPEPVASPNTHDMDVVDELSPQRPAVQGPVRPASRAPFLPPTVSTVDAPALPGFRTPTSKPSAKPAGPEAPERGPVHEPEGFGDDDADHGQAPSPDNIFAPVAPAVGEVEYSPGADDGDLDEHVDGQPGDSFVEGSPGRDLTIEIEQDVSGRPAPEGAAPLPHVQRPFVAADLPTVPLVGALGLGVNPADDAELDDLYADQEEASSSGRGATSQERDTRDGIVGVVSGEPDNAAGGRRTPAEVPGDQAGTAEQSRSNAGSVAAPVRKAQTLPAHPGRGMASHGPLAYPGLSTAQRSHADEPDPQQLGATAPAQQVAADNWDFDDVFDDDFSGLPDQKSAQPQPAVIIPTDESPDIEARARTGTHSGEGHADPLDAQIVADGFDLDNLEDFGTFDGLGDLDGMDGLNSFDGSRDLGTDRTTTQPRDNPRDDGGDDDVADIMAKDFPPKNRGAEAKPATIGTRPSVLSAFPGLAGTATAADDDALDEFELDDFDFKI